MLGDLRWLGRRGARLILKAALDALETDPIAETRNLKTLRPNPIAERELRLFGKYRALFSVDENRQLVTILVVGEKRGEAFFVRGRRYTAHESDPAQ